MKNFPWFIFLPATVGLLAGTIIFHIANSQ